MYERRSDPLLPRPEFFRRMFRHGTVAVVILAVCLAIGVVGYHHFEPLRWVDALFDASMILGGQGPVEPLSTTGGKVFASGYALFSSIIFLSTIGVFVAPMIHRMLHQFHLDAAAVKHAAAKSVKPK